MRGWGGGRRSHPGARRNPRSSRPPRRLCTASTASTPRFSPVRLPSLPPSRANASGLRGAREERMAVQREAAQVDGREVEPFVLFQITRRLPGFSRVARRPQVQDPVVLGRAGPDPASVGEHRVRVGYAVGEQLPAPGVVDKAPAGLGPAPAPVAAYAALAQISAHEAQAVYVALVLAARGAGHLARGRCGVDVEPPHAATRGVG